MGEGIFQRKEIGPIISQSFEIERLGQELEICFQDFHEYRRIKTCHGDIRKIVDTLMDYARILETGCEQWGLTGFHRATYELRAGELRKIARKYQAGIGYDYEVARKRIDRRRMMLEGMRWKSWFRETRKKEGEKYNAP